MYPSFLICFDTELLVLTLLLTIFGFLLSILHFHFCTHGIIELTGRLTALTTNKIVSYSLMSNLIKLRCSVTVSVVIFLSVSTESSKYPLARAMFKDVSTVRTHVPGTVRTRYGHTDTDGEPGYAGYISSVPVPCPFSGIPGSCLL